MRWFPLAPNWLIPAFEKRSREAETSQNDVDNVKMSGCVFSSKIVAEMSARVKVHRILWIVLFQLQFMAEEWRPDLLTLFPRFYDPSVSPKLTLCQKSRSLRNSCFRFLIKIVVRANSKIFQLQFVIETRRFDVLTLSTTFYDLSVSRNIFWKAKLCHFGVAGTLGLTCSRPYMVTMIF